MAFFGNKRKDFSIQPPRQQVDGTPFFVTDSANIDFTLENLNLTANLTQLLPVSGTYGDATNIPVLQIDQFGRVTGVTTVAIGGGGGTYTSNNGITETANNFQLGGSLVQNTLITNSGFYLRFLQSSGKALELYSNDAEALLAQRANTSRNTIDTVARLVRKSTTNPLGIWAQSGFGAALDFDLMLSNGSTVTGASIASFWNSPISPFESNNLIFSTRNAGVLSVKMGLSAAGVLNLSSYGFGTFAGTPSYALGVDPFGDIIEFPVGGSGSSLNDTTGILFGGALSATIGGTTFSVTAGIGQIVTQTASISGVVTTVSNVTWSAVTGAAITNIGTSQFTYVLVNSSGTVIQQTTPFTDAQYKTHIIIGILCHIDLASVNLVTNSQNVAYEDPHRLVELISAFGPIKKTGLNIGPNGANLRVNRTSGEAFKIGANYTTDQFEPDVAIISAKTPALLCRVHRNGSGGFIFDVNGGSYYNNIDPNNYDNGSGTLQSVGGSKWTIQRLFFFPNNPTDIICYYGVQTYNQFSEARANLEFETFDEATITAENAVFLGFLFVRNAATDLSSPTQAAFLQSGLFRGIPPGGGGSGGGGNSIGELTGDVTAGPAISPSESVVATIANNSVTYAKMQAVSATSRLLGSSSTTTPVQEITATKSVKIVSDNVELDGDETSPSANKYYGTDGTGNRGYHLLNQVPVPYIYVRKVYQLLGTYLTSMTYHPSLLFFSSFFIGGGTGGTQIYDATTAEFDSTSTFTQALYNRKVNNGGTDEIYTISQSQPSIQRLNATTGAFIANSIPSGVITTAVNTRLCQFSSTKVFLANATNYFVLNPATFVTTSLTAHGLGNIPHVAVNNNPSSPQNGTVMMGGPNGIILIDGATNAITVPATTLSSAIGPIYDIQYDSTNDVWVVVTAIGVSNNPMKIVYIKPNTATTFTVPTTVYGISLMGSAFAAGGAIYARLLIDEVSDYLFLFSNHRLTQIRLSTGDIIQSLPIQSTSPAVTTAVFSSADIDLTNKRIFAASGLNSGAGQWAVNEIMYS